jgi:hypothetical protein
MCCGAPWSSKGLAGGYAAMRDSTVRLLREATRDGELPVISDASSCTEAYAQAAAEVGITVLDAVRYTADTLLPWLAVRHRLGVLAVHPTCSSTRLGIDDAVLRLAAAVAAESFVPDGWACCGFAGDRGLLRPELTAAATRAEARAGRPASGRVRLGQPHLRDRHDPGHRRHVPASARTRRRGHPLTRGRVSLPGRWRPSLQSDCIRLNNDRWRTRVAGECRGAPTP